MARPLEGLARVAGCEHRATWRKPLVKGGDSDGAVVDSDRALCRRNDPAMVAVPNTVTNLALSPVTRAKQIALPLPTGLHPWLYAFAAHTRANIFREA